MCANHDSEGEIDRVDEKDVNVRSQLSKSNALYICKTEYSTSRRDIEYTA